MPDSLEIIRATVDIAYVALADKTLTREKLWEA